MTIADRNCGMKQLLDLLPPQHRATSGDVVVRNVKQCIKEENKKNNKQRVIWNYMTAKCTGKRFSFLIGLNDERGLKRPLHSTKTIYGKKLPK